MGIVAKSSASLYTGASESNPSVLGEAEKESFIALPGKAASGLLCLPSRELDEGFNNWFKGRASEKD